MEFKEIRRLLSYERRAVQDYEMINGGDKIAVGVSGGKDSLALLCALSNLRLFYPKKFEVCAITLDMGFEGSDFSSLERFYEDIGVEYRIVKTDLAEIIFKERKESNPCALCAKMRRGLLHDTAKEMGANKLALGHNFDDMLETFMMNLFNEGRIGTFSPVTYLDRKDITVIRPLALAPEKDIIYFVNHNDLPVIKSKCPEDKFTDRERYKQMLYSLDRERVGTMHRLFEAIKKDDVDGWGIENRSITGSAFEISSNDIEKTASYYVDTLGFSREDYIYENKKHISLKRSFAEFILKEDGEDTRKVRIISARLDSIYEEFVKNKADITVLPHFSDAKSREFEITDCDGRKIVFSVVRGNAERKEQ